MERKSPWTFEDNRVDLFIGDKEYSENLRRIRVVNSLSHVYPFVILDLFIDAKEVIKDKIFGQEPLNVKITIQDQNTEKDEIDLELMYIQSDINMVMENMAAEEKQSDRSINKFLTVCRKPYKTMTTLVNNVYENKSIREIVQSITNSLNTQATLEMTNRGENTEKIDQVLVPPLPYDKALLYLDRTFGFFNGPMTKFCKYDNNVHIKNLSSQMKEKSTIVIYYIATDNPNGGDIMTQCNDGIKFYSTYPIISKYIGNSKFTLIAPNLHFIVKPSDRLYSQVDINMPELSKEYGLVSTPRPILFDSIIDRERYITSHTGYSVDNRDDDHFAIANLSKEVSSLSSLNVTISGKMLLRNLLEPGATVEFIPGTAEYTPLSGRYILKASDITLRQVRNKEWRSSANLYLIRTNKLAG